MLPRSTAANTAFNLAGRILPALVALVCLPPLLRQLGPDRFGLLNLAWVAAGYFSVFDFGLGRALTQAVAERRALGRDDEVPGLVWTSILILVVLGALTATALATLAPWLVSRVLKVPAQLRGETIASLYLLSISLPLVMITAALRGVLEGRREFALVNALRAPMVLATFVGPLLILPFRRDLTAVVAMLVIGRLLTLAVHWWACVRRIPKLATGARRSLSGVKPLLRFGGWITVSNLISPIMVNLDRLIIGGQVSVAAIGYYSTAQQVIGQIGVIPGSYAAVLFPVFAAEQALNEQDRSSRVRKGMVWTFLMLIVPLLVACTLAREGLTLWLGSEFAAHGAILLQVLCVGALLNGMAQVPYVLVQGVGRADLSAKAHVLEVVPYLAAVWLLTWKFGVVGTAVAWVLRVGVDLTVMAIIAGALAGGGWRSHLQAGGCVVAGGLSLGLGALMPTLSSKVLYLVIGGVIGGSMIWRVLLSDGERSRLRRLVVRTQANVPASH